MPKKTSNSPKLFSLNKKLQLIIAPLLIVSFIITGVIIFASSSKSMMANTKELLAQEAESACKSLTITMLSETGRRSFYGSSHEKRWNENIQSNLLCNTIRHYNRSGGLFWSTNWNHFQRGYCYLLIFCSRSYVIYCIWRINSRIQ